MRALCGSKSAAASWRAKISKIIEDLGFTMCRSDNAVWMRPGINAKGEEVHECVLVHSDDLLFVALVPMSTAAQIDQNCKLKDGSVKTPE